MKRLILLSVISFLLCINAFSRVDHLEAAKLADKFLHSLTKNDGQAMYNQFNDTVKKQLSLEQTSSIWGQITGMYGEFKSFGEIKTTDYKEFVICRNILEFQKGLLEATVTIDSNSLISGFYITPKQAEDKYIIPQYADTAKFVEMLIKFGEENFILDGVMSLPVSSKPTPVVILVHGSGPHDMDETIGPNKPFKDLAWGLASNGIACLRYNKRTKQYPEKMLENFENSDIYDEVINDVTYAVNFLNHNYKNYNIDSSKIYIIGHSLGGTLLPRIVQKNQNAAGIISLAGMTRKIENVLLSQYQYLYQVDGELSEDEKTKIEELKIQIKKMQSPDLNKSVPADSLPLNMPANYWLTFRDVDPAKEIRVMDKRVLILQGERDYQVTLEDFNIWKDALIDNPKAEFKSYKDLNHLFQIGEGKSKPEEYYKPVKVDGRIIKDISDWIKE
ncbi:MAG: DUF3887 domain-containing protein [Candidatus Kapabacteria bacterium]|nr:DUF3887 domain-containing protein [Candidatus Kapabacteria bacterium]